MARGSFEDKAQAAAKASLRDWSQFTWVSDRQRVAKVPVVATNWAAAALLGVGWWQWDAFGVPVMGALTGGFLMWTVGRAAVALPAQRKVISALYGAAKPTCKLPNLTRANPAPDRQLVDVTRWRSRNTPERGFVVYGGESRAAQLAARGLVEKDIERVLPQVKGRAWVFDWDTPGTILFALVADDDPRVQQRATRSWIEQVLAKLFPRIPDLGLDIAWTADPEQRPDLPATITVSFGATITANAAFRAGVEDQFGKQVDRGQAWLYDWQIGQLTITSADPDSPEALQQATRSRWQREIITRAKDAFGFRNVGEVTTDVIEWAAPTQPAVLSITFEQATLDPALTDAFEQAFDAAAANEWPTLCWLADWTWGHITTVTYTSVPHTHQMAQRKLEERRLRSVVSDKFRVPRGAPAVGCEVTTWRTIDNGDGQPKREKPTQVEIVFGTLDVNDYQFRLNAERHLDSLYPDTGWAYRWDVAEGQCHLTEVPALPRVQFFPQRGSDEFAALENMAREGKIVFGLAKGGGHVATDFTKVPHTLVGGNTGSGKSVALTIVLFWALYLFDEFEIIVCDPKLTDFPWTAEFPNVRFAATIPEITAAVKYAHTRMEGNQKLLRKHGVENMVQLRRLAAAGKVDSDEVPRRLILFFDEMASFFNKSKDEDTAVLQGEARADTEQIMMLGRAPAVNVFGAAQKPSRENLGTAIRELFGTRIGIGWMKDNMSTQVLGNNLASLLDRENTPKGRGWFLTEGEADKIGQTYYLPKRTEVPDFMPIGSPEVEGVLDMVRDRLLNAGYQPVQVPGEDGILEPRWVLPDGILVEEDSAQDVSAAVPAPQPENPESTSAPASTADLVGEPTQTLGLPDDDPWNSPAALVPEAPTAIPAADATLPDDDPWNSPAATALSDDDPWSAALAGLPDDDPWSAALQAGDALSDDDPWNQPEPQADDYHRLAEPFSPVENDGAPVTVDIMLGDAASPQYARLGVSDGQQVGIDLNSPRTITLVGAQGSGKSYTLGTLIEGATMAIPGGNRLPAPLATIAFHYSPTRDYEPEFVSMRHPNTDPADVTRLQYEGMTAAGLSEVLVLTTDANVDSCKAAYPDADVLPIRFSSHEMKAAHWKSLMGTVGNNAMYLRQINHIMREARDHLTLDAIQQGVLNSDMPPHVQQLALTRLRFAAAYVDDSRPMQPLIQPGRLVVVDLRDSLVEKDEALGLFVVLLQIAADATRPDGSPINKLVVMDEAHKLVSNPALAESVVEVVREMRHKGTSVLVASQDPLSVPTALLELSTDLIVHRFGSKAWLSHIQKANSGLAQLTSADVAGLDVGEALVWSSRRSTGEGPLRVTIRRRVTDHGGATQTAVRA